MDILSKIDEMRRERGWSINYLAMEAMLTQSTINNLYTRKTEPKISTLRAICGAFNITLAQFFEECEGKPLKNESILEDKTTAEIAQLVYDMPQEQKVTLLTFLRTIQ